MKQLIRINLSLMVKNKMLLITALVFILISVFQALSLLTYSDRQGIHLGDYYLLSMGGVLINDSYSRQLVWITVIVPVLLYTYHLVGFAGSYDVFILTRLQSRFLWWKSKFISMTVFILFYGIFLNLIHIIVGVFFFPVNRQWGSFL